VYDQGGLGCVSLSVASIHSNCLESFGSRHILACLGSILSVGGPKGMVPTFLNFQTASGDTSCLFSQPRWVVCNNLFPGCFATDY
jgi:hypothetical protein